ncbi:flippase-like domain-containing protein [Candidatus Parcubacteria bacterium]|nr:flippase-like domain-containing protein [Candidatus Parcubacteria bacterium]
MKKFIFFSFTLLIGLILFFIAFKEIGLENIVSALSNISISQFFFVFGVIIFSFLVGTLRLKIILKTQLSEKISFLDVLIARTVGFTINYLTPVIFAGGQPFKAYIIKEKTKASLDKIIVSIIISEAVFLSILFFFIVLGVLFLFLSFNLPFIFEIIISGITLFFFLIFCLFYSRIIRKSPDKKGFFTFFIEFLRLDRVGLINGMKTKIADIERDIFYFFKHQKAKLIIVSFLTLIEILLLILSYWLIILFLGSILNFKELLSVNALIDLVYFIPIPAALGSFEWSQALIFDIFGLNLNMGIAFSLIVRCFSLIMAGLGILLLVHFEIKTLAERLGAAIQKFVDIFRNNKI